MIHSVYKFARLHRVMTVYSHLTKHWLFVKTRSRIISQTKWIIIQGTAPCALTKWLRLTVESMMLFRLFPETGCSQSITYFMFKVRPFTKHIFLWDYNGSHTVNLQYLPSDSLRGFLKPFNWVIEWDIVPFSWGFTLHVKIHVYRINCLIIATHTVTNNLYQTA